MQSIEHVLNFIVEIEQLKNVVRGTRPIGLNRYENSAEHSWHVCLSALMLKDYADEDVDIDRVIKMLLIHDLGEIDAGDTIIYKSETDEVKKEEEAGITRVLGLLGEAVAEEYLTLWHEFESAKTADSRFARAIDRVPPLLHNLYGEGHSWKTHNIPKEKVFEVNKRIGLGSQQLWTELENRLNQAVADGLLK